MAWRNKKSILPSKRRVKRSQTSSSHKVWTSFRLEGTKRHGVFLGSECSFALYSHRNNRRESFIYDRLLNKSLRSLSYSGFLLSPAVSIPVTASNACASAISILLPATTGFPSPPTANCPVRSRCSLILLSIYSLLSSFLWSSSISSADLGNDANLGRSFLRIACSAGSCDKINVVFVVIGVCFAFDPAVTPTRNWCAAGLDVRNERSKSGRFAVCDLVSPSPSADFAASTVDRMDFS